LKNEILTYLPANQLDSESLKALMLLGITFLFFWLLLLFGRVIKKYRGIAATSAMFVNTVIAAFLFFEIGNKEVHHFCFEWINVGNLQVNFGVSIDGLSALFALIVCFISFLVHLFSIEYLRGDSNFEKYFGYLSLFTFSMLGIIFSHNLLQLFVFWELVGFSSYLLIGFWYKNEAAVLANKKAFIVNRVGDVGFLFGICLIFAFSNTLNIVDIQLFINSISVSDSYDFHYLIQGNVLSKGWLILAGLGISSGALAKSAQFPFSIWLPNAMEGPTPVSALIHAATMVAAGIYLLARFTFIFPNEILDFLAILGVLTALLAAISALTQNDIKRVLAYSTISQLGYMVMAIGVRAYDAALFHLLTHAFFKAALFLCAGAIIYSLHKVDTAYGIKKLYPQFDEQNMRQMGGMRHKMPFVFWVYTIALCGIIGVPFFTGFLSKDAILMQSFNWAAAKSPMAYLIPITALFTVALTAFYMLRQYLMIFFGENRISDELQCPVG
jgi:NADH-quinone oxidoreductase subunit L